MTVKRRIALLLFVYSDGEKKDCLTPPVYSDGEKKD